MIDPLTVGHCQCSSRVVGVPSDSLVQDRLLGVAALVFLASSCGAASSGLLG
jgi:hypothetical protein